MREATAKRFERAVIKLVRHLDRQQASSRTDLWRPEGYRLAHNFVRPTTADQPHGLNGFRRFWIPPEYIEEGEWVKCDCGWRADLGPHYRL